MSRSIYLALIVLFLPMFLFSQPLKKTNTPVVKYNATAQEKYLPEIPKGLFLGMTYEQLKKIVTVEKMEYEGDYFDSVAKLTEYYPAGTSYDEVKSATFYFAISDTTIDALSIPGKNRLFEIVLEFEKQDAGVFVQRYKKDKAAKGSLTENGWKWTFKTSDGVDWIVRYDGGFFVTITGNIKGTPWQKNL